MSCKLEVLSCEVGVGVGWCDLEGWNTKLELVLELEYKVQVVKIVQEIWGEIAISKRLWIWQDCERFWILDNHKF